MNLTGLLIINGVDAYIEYSAFLAELEEYGHVNSDALLAVPAVKAVTSVSFKERNGEDLPDSFATQYEAIDRTLQLCIISDTLPILSAKFSTFIDAIKSGWLTIVVKDLRTYKMIYREVSNLRIYNDTNCAACTFNIKFREPKYKA